MEKIKKHYKLIIIIIISATSLIFYSFESNKNLVINGHEVSETKNQNKIAVYVTGAVNKEGVYYCKKNAILNDVISEAGGIKKEADLNKVNLAHRLKDGDKIVIPFKSADIDMESGEEITDEENKKININKASQSELMNIPGVGESTAKKIIEYRNKNEFEQIEDLMNVPGIGESKFEKMKDLVLV